MKCRIEAEFYCYIDENGMQKHVLNKDDLETAEAPEVEEDQTKLDLDKQLEYPYPAGTKFAIFTDGAKRLAKTADNYAEVMKVRSDSLDLRTATGGSKYSCTKERIQERIDKNEYRVCVTDKTLSELFESLADNPDEAEVPITADGTSVENAVHKAIGDLVGHLDRPLRLSGTNTGIWSGKKIGGDVEICKQEVHDLLDEEAKGLRAVFVVTLMDKK